MHAAIRRAAPKYKMVEAVPASNRVQLRWDSDSGRESQSRYGCTVHISHPLSAQNLHGKRFFQFQELFFEQMPTQ